MSYRLYQKSYPGEIPRPSVMVDIYDKEGLVLIATPWGNKDAHKMMTGIMRDYFNAALSDPEATSPFSKMPGLSAHGNCLRASILLANDTLFQRYNKDKTTSGAEVLALSLNNTELNWVLVGQPHVLLLREGKIFTLQSGSDLGFQFDITTSLPEKLLGVDRQIEIETHSFFVMPGDRFIFLTRRSVPQSFFSQDWGNKNIQELCQSLFDLTSSAVAAEPFWLGVLEFS